ncbi:uncharacterized protein LOC120629849 isoform X2 [Pararge aegeria]|uniref:uncharacterized protein LOC120629849 isoform X2 n=1 Tax=Pararge aegeria TaxID=116150 RepID=UPI0019D1C5D9|nr:uncharacterized protein LOC120629849 isoform X2 [Pararge aegeria]
MEYQDQADYNNIIDVIISTFGEVLSRDVLYNIVENFGGDLEESANAVMNIIMEEKEVNNTQPGSSINQLEQAVEEDNQPKTYKTSSDINNTMDYKTSGIFKAAASNANTSRSAIPLVYQASNATSAPGMQNVWTDQIGKIFKHHEKGSRILIIMRGLPGSGKTYLAERIIDAIYCTRNQYYSTHILSTDAYFMRNGDYIYDKSRISEAHEWNQRRARDAMAEGVSPVIIDNTNIELWEMECYVVQGVKNGYIIEVLEPNTPWAKKANQLCRRNSHNVPVAAIRRKLDNFQSGINGDYLLKIFKLRYTSSERPPILRTKPPFSLKLTDQSINTESVNISESNKDSVDATHDNSQRSLAEITIDNSQKSSPLSNNCDQFAELQKCLEEMEKVEKEWENGDNWEDNGQNKAQNSVDSGSVSSKPQRQNKLLRSGITENFQSSDEVDNDWSRCFKLLPSWGEASNITQMECIPVIEKRSSSTCIEYGDTTISPSKNPLKVLTAAPRNINEYHVPVKDKKMPEKWMLDKSTSTNNNNNIITFNCPNKEQHFNVFRKLFKNIARSDLRDVFDNCFGDVNWAVNIVLTGGAGIKLDNVDSNDYSDTEAEAQEDNVDLCQCLAAYDIIPDHNNPLPPPVLEINNTSHNTQSTPTPLKSKGKKENTVSVSSIQLKRQIEKNVVISDNHYSEHCLKIRKLRRGESITDEVGNTNDEQSNTVTPEPHKTENNEACTSSNEQYISNHNNNPSTSRIENNDAGTENSPVVFEDIEKNLSINLGKEFVSQLDDIFGRRNMEYPPNVIPKINMPMSLLEEINALWMESLVDQLDEDVKQSAEMMVQQDVEFAYQLAKKQAEMTKAGKEPEVPDFKELMDLDLALSIYRKDIDEWRNNLPDDLAARLTREKLYNLFQDVPHDILTELLMAHDNNFQETVETISEVEWPLLPKSEKVDMLVVDHYRDEAEKHLRSRNHYYQKAQEYIRRGMTPAATYVSGVAEYHKRMYELSNSKAAATLIQFHASRSPDNSSIDLHYLRVGEAKESLDLFIDTHIQKLREMLDKNGVQFHTLFFITGRGLHSNGKPKIKPAVMKRLLERGLAFTEKNPGLLTARVSAIDKLSDEIA